MRQTFTDLITIGQNGAGQDTSTTTQTFLKQRINARAEQVLSLLPTYLSEITRTFSTVADQQYYHYPPNFREIESLKITIGSVSYDLDPIHSNQEWIDYNKITIQPSAIPQFYFKRQRDFGLWPIPGGVYTGTIEYSIRAGGMTKSDYTTGTVTVTENDETVTGSATTFTGGNAVADMWFSLADSNGESKGDWYRIASVTDGTNLELESVFEGSSAAGENYIIGESPELPEDLHELLAYGAVADYFAMLRQDQVKAQGWSNMFWTGDWGNSSRNPRNVKGGLIGGITRYQNRNNSQLIKRRPKLHPSDKVWATTLS